MAINVREQFWGDGLTQLPADVTLRRLDTLVLPARGPGGQAIIDVAELRAADTVLPCLLAYRGPLSAPVVRPLVDRLRAAEATLHRRGLSKATRYEPVIVTDAAGPAVMATCESERVGLLDLRGTVLVRGRGIYLRVVGTHRAAKTPRVSAFRGKALRIVRVLLTHSSEPFSIVRLARQSGLVYSHAHAVVERLDLEGFLVRTEPTGRTQYRVRDPIALLRAWRTAALPPIIQAWNARSTQPDSLAAGHAALSAAGGRAIFTMGSALLSTEVHVSPLPHGLYTHASADVVRDCFGLRAQTPHNFFVLRPDPANEGDLGGIYESPRQLPHGPAVCVPQLVVDLSSAGGRGSEQADHLAESWGRQLPPEGP